MIFLVSVIYMQLNRPRNIGFLKYNSQISAKFNMKKPDNLLLK